MGLGVRQSRFVVEYLVDQNATAAAKRAGYASTQRSAEVQGSLLLRNPEVRRCIDEALARRAARVEVKADDILRELLRLAMVDIGEAFDEEGRLKPIKDIPPDVRRAISGVDVTEIMEDGRPVGLLKKVRLWDKKGSLELLGKHLRLFVDRLEATGKDGEPLEVVIRTVVEKEAGDAVQKP